MPSGASGSLYRKDSLRIRLLQLELVLQYPCVRSRCSQGAEHADRMMVAEMAVGIVKALIAEEHIAGMAMLKDVTSCSASQPNFRIHGTRQTYLVVAVWSSCQMRRVLLNETWRIWRRISCVILWRCGSISK